MGFTEWVGTRDIKRKHSQNIINTKLRTEIKLYDVSWFSLQSFLPLDDENFFWGDSMYRLEIANRPKCCLAQFSHVWCYNVLIMYSSRYILSALPQHGHIRGATGSVSLHLYRLKWTLDQVIKTWTFQLSYYNRICNTKVLLIVSFGVKNWLKY